MDQQSPKRIIDVEQLVADLKRRVERERAQGAYEDDLSDIELEIPAPVAEAATPSMMHGFDLGGPGPRVRFRPELGFSDKPVIGPVITLVKRFFLRLLFYVFDDLARQTDAAIARVEAALAVDVAARERLEGEARRLEGEARRLEGEARRNEVHLSAETARREGIERDVRSLSERIAGIDNRLEHLGLEGRLARLERARKPTAPQPVARSEKAAAAVAPPFDYESFEARFRPETSVRERQQPYVELLLDRKRVADLGCGRGELIEMLNEQGVSAYGVEIDPDFISLLEEKGVEVVAKDAVAHLAELEENAVDGIVASHLVEHLPASAVSSLITLAAEKLAADGILILETPNPESLVAGSVNFHRDLTHVRPIHPDTLAFLCDSAGFSHVEIRRLSPVPDEERLPAPGDRRLDEIVSQLNNLLYGYQDYAVVARRR
jgi:O-antigen chain-terminating methyltransferase